MGFRVQSFRFRVSGPPVTSRVLSPFDGVRFPHKPVFFGDLGICE